MSGGDAGGGPGARPALDRPPADTAACMVAGLPLPVLLFDRDGRLRHANPAACGLFSAVFDRLAAGAAAAPLLGAIDQALAGPGSSALLAALDAAPAERRTLLFSATLARDIVELAKRYQNDAVRIDTIGRNEPHRDIEYRAVRVAPNEVEHAVVNLLRFFEAPGALVFANTRESVRSLHAKLRERGFAVVGLSGELSQRERADALQALRDGHARVCVATDVAARGLDLPDLGLVIHAELPINKATLLHRSGRTGRAGKKGVSALVVPYTRRRKAEQLLYAAGVEADWGGAPSADSIREKDQERLLEDPIFSETSTEEDIALAEAMLAKRTPVEIAAALIRTRRAKLPSPEDIYDDPRHGADPGPRSREPREPREFGERPEREPRVSMEGSEWFRISVGRRGNADPKWLIPMICRLGHITKKDIGAIRIFDYDTKFEISAEAAVKFGAAVQTTVREDVSITPTTAPAPREAGPRRDFTPRPPRGDNDGPREYKPRARRDRDDAPRSPRANAPGSRDHTPRPSSFGDDGFSNAKPYGRGEEPKGDYKPRRAPRDNDAPRPYSPQDSDGAPKRAFKPRHEASADAPREYKPRASRVDGDAPKKPFKKAFSDNAAGPKPYAKPYAGKRDGDEVPVYESLWKWGVGLFDTTKTEGENPVKQHDGRAAEVAVEAVKPSPSVTTADASATKVAPGPAPTDSSHRR